MVDVRSFHAATALAFGLTFLSACGGSDTTSSAVQGRGGRAAGAQPNVEVGLDLKGMLAPVPEYKGQGRNLFAYGPVRREAPPPRPPTTTSVPRASVAPRPTSTAPPRPTTPPAARVDVKYAGFVEKTDEAGEKAKYAIFLDGNEIMAGAEGETVSNRFTVVEIGLESVTVSPRGSSATQRIPLQAN